MTARSKAQIFGIIAVNARQRLQRRYTDDVDDSRRHVDDAVPQSAQISWTRHISKAQGASDDLPLLQQQNVIMVPDPQRGAAAEEVVFPDSEEAIMPVMLRRPSSTT